ncbi:MAG TPA: hypothetical protein PKN12_10305 [Bacteroidales bacterium]|nr:hypothetical protein [Bacteroidales bacterium]
MKKLLMSFTFLLFGIVLNAQILTIPLAVGAKGVDSLYGATTKYYYVKASGTFTTKASSPITAYGLYAIQAGTVRSVEVTGTDSCQITFEVSLDNTNWHKFTGTTPKVTGGAVYTTIPDMVTTTTDGNALFQPSACYFPYIRVKFQHYKASCTMYPRLSVTLKKL